MILRRAAHPWVAMLGATTSRAFPGLRRASAKSALTGDWSTTTLDRTVRKVPMLVGWRAVSSLLCIIAAQVQDSGLACPFRESGIALAANPLTHLRNQSATENWHG